MLVRVKTHEERELGQKSGRLVNFLPSFFLSKTEVGQFVSNNEWESQVECLNLVW